VMNTTGMVGLLCSNMASKLENKTIFLKRFIARKVWTVCTRTSYKIVHLTNLKRYLHNDTR
jgi:nucleoside-triphosphatase THEP1